MLVLEQGVIVFDVFTRNICIPRIYFDRVFFLTIELFCVCVRRCLRSKRGE